MKKLFLIFLFCFTGCATQTGEQRPVIKPAGEAQYCKQNPEAPLCSAYLKK